MLKAEGDPRVTGGGGILRDDSLFGIACPQLGHVDEGTGRRKVGKLRGAISSTRLEMTINRRTFLEGLGVIDVGIVRSAGGAVPTRFLVVGNPLGMHPDHFFPR